MKSIKEKSKEYADEQDLRMAYNGSCDNCRQGNRTMNKAEEFIKAKTRIGSNTTKGWRRNGVSIPSYSLPWLTPDQARKAVEIAREETIKEVCEWIKYNNENGGCSFDGWENDLKKHLNSKV